MKNRILKGTLVAATVLVMLTIQPLVAAAQREDSDAVTVVQHFLTFNITSSNPGDCNPSTSFLPVPPSPTCVSSFILTGTSGLPAPQVPGTLYMTTNSPYLNENVEMWRADGSFIYTDFTDYDVSITDHGTGTFTQLETDAAVQPNGIGTSLNCVVPGSATGDFVGMTGCGILTSTTSNTLGDIVWHLHFPKHH
jgi:hypothetical protein